MGVSPEFMGCQLVQTFTPVNDIMGEEFPAQTQNDLPKSKNKYTKIDFNSDMRKLSVLFLDRSR